ncbi:TBC1 domain family member 10A-like isoform X2 [Lethenteron reissneri]|uniref:TBC1 domain family member 10A-like isoform X2 n=1 Tax=Lethenteron reissneri TaxID=7753 RepID=UPI002AB692FA|nr:TBC1 domain family member 10A-like isoform X2 [Lethenteron reissneri]
MAERGVAEAETTKPGQQQEEEEVEEEVEEVPLELVREREVQWLRVLSDWDGWMGARPGKVRELCRLGVPNSLRARVWLFMTGARTRMQRNPGKFQELASAPGDPRWVEAIERDVHRQFPSHEMFTTMGGYGQRDLAQVLRAFSVLCPEVGYCQAQAPIAATLLMRMPAEEAVQQDCELLSLLLAPRLSPHARVLLHRLQLPPTLILPEWLLCAFARTLPAPSLARVWDMFLCEGVKVLLRVALVLLIGTFEELAAAADAGNAAGNSAGTVGNASDDLYSVLQALRCPSRHNTHPSSLVPQMLSLSLSTRRLRRLHLSVIRDRRRRRNQEAA